MALPLTFFFTCICLFLPWSFPPSVAITSSPHSSSSQFLSSFLLSFQSGSLPPPTSDIWICSSVIGQQAALTPLVSVFGVCFTAIAIVSRRFLWQVQVPFQALWSWCRNLCEACHIIILTFTTVRQTWMGRLIGDAFQACNKKKNYMKSAGCLA